MKLNSLNLPYGAHCLADFKAGWTANDLHLVALREVRRGSTIYEIGTRQLTGISAKDTAKALIDAGMRRAVKSRFFLQNGSWGDPLGIINGEKSVALAIDTIKGDADYLAEMQAEGLDIEILAGPLYHCVGFDYSNIPPEEILVRGRRFMENVSLQTQKSKIKFAAEPLRKAEAVGIPTSVYWLKSMLFTTKDRAGILLDVHHEVDHGRNPADEIIHAGSNLIHFHGHGYNRVPAGVYSYKNSFFTDPINWWHIRCALEAIGYQGAVIGEPFGQGIRDIAPSLGEGIPKALPPDEFFVENWAHLRMVGII